ncbi:MAG: thioredoxin family protein [Alphaproteobacteria bacterium]|nr:thioredoxin family protein [Alphaproteobacteria bacterium]
MQLNRRNALLLSAGAAASSLLPETLRAAEVGTLNDDGLHTQPWFHTSFLDLKEDAAEAHAAGKSLAVIWEQKGCPYCAEMHRVNLAKKEITDYIRAHFVVLQLNLYGARGVTDFDGKEMEERQLARRWKVNFTPTISYFPKDPALSDGKVGSDAEVWRLTGFWKPFHFLSSFRYVATGGYESEPNFQKWMTEYREQLEAKGEKVDIW